MKLNQVPLPTMMWSCSTPPNVPMARLISPVISMSARDGVVAATLAELRKRVAAYPELIFTSSETGEGIPDLRTAVALLLRQRGV